MSAEDSHSSVFSENENPLEHFPEKSEQPVVAEVIEPFIPHQQESTDTSPSTDEPDQRKEATGICATVLAMLRTLIPAGGMLATGFSIASTSIGAGILGLPSAFSNVGIVMGAIYLILVTAETVYSMYLLVKVAEKTGLRSVEDMGTKLVHRHGVYLMGGVRVVHMLSACTAYVCTVGDLMTPILDNASGTPEFLKKESGVRVLQAAVWLVFFLPLSIPREVNSVRYVSMVGIVMMIYFSFVVIVHSAMNGLQEDPRPPVQAVRTGNRGVKGLGTFIFCYMCQANGVEIFYEMTNRSVARFTLCAAISISVCGSLYFFTGLFGYMDYGISLSESILVKYYPLEEPQVMVSYVGVFIKICASYALLGGSGRYGFYEMVGWDRNTVAFWKHLIVVLVMCTITLLLGLFVPNVTTMFDFAGGFCGGIIAFLCPALFMMYSGGWSLKTMGWGHYLATYFTLFGGVVAVVFGTASTIYFTINPL